MIRRCLSKCWIGVVVSVVLVTVTPEAGALKTIEELEEGFSVVVSIAPYAGIVKRLVDSDTQVKILVPKSRDPHLWEPTQRQIAYLSSGDLYIAAGTLPFELWLNERFPDICPDTKLLNLSEQVPLLKFEEHNEEALQRRKDLADSYVSSEYHNELDPHMWLSPVLLKQQAQRIAEALKELRPEKADVYDKRLADYLSDLDEVHQELTIQLAPYKGATVLVFHPAFGYFCQAYGLKQRAVQSEGKSPSPRELQEIIETARQDGTRIIFTQPQFEPHSVDAIASAIGAVVVTLDPLEEDVIQNLRTIAQRVEESAQ